MSGYEHPDCFGQIAARNGETEFTRHCVWIFDNTLQLVGR
jgi:hypothetical protein